jgi:peptide/nickel transport system permease protein
MPGDPAASMFGRFKRKLNPEAMAALKEAFGFTDDPLPVQYFTYLAHVIQGDLGISISYYPATVSSVIGTAMIWTLLLAGASVIISFIIGTALGIYAAWRRDGPLDSVVAPSLIFLGAFPYFWLAMVAVYGLGFTLDWFPMRHAYDLSVTPGWSLDFFASVIRHAALPAGTMVIASLGGWMLSMRSTMLGALGDDFITYARARGLPPRRVLVHYAGRNALLPSLTGFGMAFGFVLSGALLTEIVFAYPGQGYLLIQAVRAQDYPLMQALFLTITFAVLAANWLVDVATVALDPRTR